MGTEEERSIDTKKKERRVNQGWVTSATQATIASSTKCGVQKACGMTSETAATTITTTTTTPTATTAAATECQQAPSLQDCLAKTILPTITGWVPTTARPQGGR